MDYTFIQDLAMAVEIPEESTISKTVYRDDWLKIVLFGFAAGQELSEHTAAVPAILQFLDGEASVTVGEDTLIATGGTFIHMAPHLPHSIAAKTGTRMLLTMVSGAKQ